MAQSSLGPIESRTYVTLAVARNVHTAFAMAPVEVPSDGARYGGRTPSRERDVKQGNMILQFGETSQHA
jgi:hypothetical protein